MDTKGAVFLSCCLLLLFGFQHSTAHPVDSLSPAKELASMEALLERLEEKVALMEDLQSDRDSEEPQGQMESQVADSEDSSDQQPETRADSAPLPSYRSSWLKHMRGLQAPKSLRESGCFGRRLDRIGSMSSLGCKGKPPRHLTDL
ncbi:natriuretic peptides A-like [Eublepharis macularius]|uniref:Natriuretic peptides A-like n=1 Tax=Eublepharis macularius TaxID=481883 RepID=A0AA97KLI6_EUBMA|nr:natriuretic peptides A-like [Eublepharis macularius]